MIQGPQRWRLAIRDVWLEQADMQEFVCFLILCQLVSLPHH